MPSNFPTSLDSYAGHNPGDVILDTHVDNVEDAIEAIEAVVGITGSAVTTSHDYRITQLEAGGGVVDLSLAPYSAPLDGSSDDRPAFQDAVDDLIALGGGTITWPDDRTCTFTTATQGTAGGNPACIVIHGDRICVSSRGKLLITNTTNTPATFFVNGGSKAARLATASHATWYDYSLTGNSGNTPTVHSMTLASTFDKGAMQITLQTAGDGSNYAVGDWIFIRTGQTLAGGVAQPISEINRVAAISGGTIDLEFPLAHTYQRQWYISGSNGLTTTTDTGGLTAAPFGITYATDRLIHDVVLENFEVDSRSGSPLVIGAFAVRPVFRNLHGRIKGASLESFGCHRDHIVQNNRIHTYDLAGLTFAFTTDAGSVDAKSLANTWSSEDFPVSDHVHEGAAGTLIFGDTFRCPSIAADYNLVSVRAYAEDTSIIGCHLYGGGPTQIMVDDTSHNGISTGHVHHGLTHPLYGTVLSTGVRGWTLGPSTYLGSVQGYYAFEPDQNVLPEAPITIPAAMLTPSTGSTVPLEAVGTDGHLGRTFAAAAINEVMVTIPIPTSWDLAYIYAQVVNRGADTGDVYWYLQGERIARDGTVDSGTAINTGNITPAPSGTLASKLTLMHSTPAEQVVNGGGVLALKIGRLGTNGADTVTNDVAIEYIQVYRVR